MASTNKEPVLVVLQLTGANDYLNTIVPYTNGHYWDARPKVNIPEHQVVPIDNELAFRSDMDQFKDIYDKGKMDRRKCKRPGCPGLLGAPVLHP